MTNYKSFNLQDKDFLASFNKVYSYSEKALENLLFPKFTDHGINHSERILLIIDTILEKNKKTVLNESEIYVMLCSVLLHDIGMQYDKNQENSDQRREEHHIYSGDIVRRNHIKIGIIPKYVDTISLVIEGHRGNIDGKYKDEIIGTGNIIRTDLLASLLFLGDELDITRDRINENKKDYQHYSLDEYFHYYKHLFTEGLNIAENKSIKISFCYPENRTNTYRDVFEKEVIRKIEKTINEITPILIDKYNIIVLFNKDCISRKESLTIDDIPPNIFEKLFSISKGIRNFTFLKNLKLEELNGDINAELFYKGNVRWADIVNDLDIERDQEQPIKELLVRHYNKTCETQSLTCILITGEGGAGKTTTLMRLAYDTALSKKYDDIDVLWWQGDSEFKLLELKKFNDATQKPLFLFADVTDAEYVVDSIKSYYEKFHNLNIPVIIIFAARLNEWRVSGGFEITFELFSIVTLNKLTDKEIEKLLFNLNKYNQLYELEKLEYKDRVDVFKSKCDSQLLIALLEATRGERFYKIILNEYDNIKKLKPQAATAYELICLFYFYDVLIPENLLITLTGCYDNKDFEENVLQFTYLVIVKQPLSKFGPNYKPRHKEIANILLESLQEFDSIFKRVKKSGVVLRQIDTDDRSQRYVILHFFNNLLTHIIKTYRKNEYEDSLDVIRKFIKNDNKIPALINKAYLENRMPELFLWSKLLSKLKITKLNIETFKKIIALNKYDQKANYNLAKILSRTYMANECSSDIITYYHNSYLGGNRTINFLYDYVLFCIKIDDKEHLKKIINDLKNFISYTPEEKDLGSKILRYLEGYKYNYDINELSTKFSALARHLALTKNISPAEEIEYIDIIESKHIEETIRDYVEYLYTITPNRPKSILFRIAHLSAKLQSGKEEAIKYFQELYELYLAKELKVEDYEILFEYAQLLSSTKREKDVFIIEIFRKLIRLKPNEINTYFEFAKYIEKISDVDLLKSICNEGINKAREIDKYNTLECKGMRKVLESIKI